MGAGRHAEAEARAREVLRHQPRNARAHFILALCALMQQRHEDALACAERALRSDRVNARYHFVAALCLAPLGRRGEAIDAYRRALQYRPDFTEASVNLARTLESEGRLEEAAATLERAAALRPDFAAIHNELALVLHRLQRIDDAIARLRRAVELEPGLVEGWRNLGKILYVRHIESPQPQSARVVLDCFDRILALEPDVEIQYLRDCVAGVRVERPPDAYVRQFFDRFSTRFEDRLLAQLEYRAPEVAAQALEPWLAQRKALRIVDLGCGSGLFARVLRPAAAHLVGVDLSSGMLDLARAREAYDELVAAEIGGYLAGEAPESFDLAVALDVFIYVGALERVFTACAAALRRGGRLVLSVEALRAQGDYALAPAGRYSHSQDYVERAAREAGLRVGQAREFVIRKEAGADVPALLFVLEKD